MFNATAFPSPTARAAPETPPKALKPASQRVRSPNRWSQPSRDARNTPKPPPKPIRSFHNFADTQVHYREPPQPSW